ncbi:MAG: cytidine deaminase [Clostridia bacterium]
MKPIHDFEVKNMLKMAEEAKDRAYAPYSKFRVGACLKGATGAYYLGSNVENASYGATICAERMALLKAVYEGERVFDALAIGGDGGGCPPCGMCLQMLSEFCDPEMPVIFRNISSDITVVSLSELMPKAFLKERLTNA